MPLWLSPQAAARQPLCSCLGKVRGCPAIVSANLPADARPSSISLSQALLLFH